MAITYAESGSPYIVLRVLLNSDSVGLILAAPNGAEGFYYAPKQGTASRVYATIDEVKRYIDEVLYPDGAPRVPRLGR